MLSSPFEWGFRRGDRGTFQWPIDMPLILLILIVLVGRQRVVTVRAHTPLLDLFPSLAPSLSWSNSGGSLNTTLTKYPTYSMQLTFWEDHREEDLRTPLLR